MIRKQGSFAATVCAAALLLAGLCAAPAFGYEFSDDADWEEMSNRYISIYLGISGWFKPGNEEWKIPGRWMVATAEGDPETTKDNRHALLFFPRIYPFIVPCYYFGFFQVKVGTQVYFIGDTNSGYWSKRPLAYNTPPPGYGVGRAGGFMEGEWTMTGDGGPVAALRIKMSMVRDQCRFEFTLTNKGTTSQSIGLQMHGDTLVDESCSTAFAYVPGLGYSRSAANPMKAYPLMLSGNNIPGYFDTYDSVESPIVVARNTLRIQDCTPPDYLTIWEFANLCSPGTWMPEDFNPDYLKPLDDLVFAVTWNPRTLPPGGTRKIVTYYGVGAASSVWNYRVGTRMEQDHICMALQAPNSLRYDSTIAGANNLDPSSFTIKAYLYNMATDPGPYDLEGVTATLYLPPGLELTTSPPQSAQQSLGRISVNSEALPATWTVQATGEYCGELEYFVTARAASGWQQVVSRKIMVPATKKLVFRSGWQMMHVPFTFNNPAIEHAFGLPLGSFAARYYDPATGQYLPVRQLVPGQAFWMYVGNVASGRTQSHQLVSDAAIVGEDFGKQSREQYIDLRAGWNLVGNPFVYPVYWGQVEVYNTTTNTTVSLEQAVKNNWISKTVFSWIPQSGTYESFKENDRLLLPWRGYWVRAIRPVTLVLRPSVPPGSDVTANPGGY